MKHHLTLAAKGVAAAVAAMSVACSSGSSAPADAAPKSDTKTSADAKASLPNFRYIDADSVSANYNLAKDFKEAALRTMSKLENAQNAKAAEIQRAGQKIQQQMESNYYVGKQQEYEADMTRFQKMQRDAESYLANLQRSSQQELAQQQQELNDSLDAFLKDFNKKMGYDAILFKAAGAYFNPALDITKEVTEGLNARYNKVDKKK